MIHFGAISWRFLKVWRRNLLTYQKIWKINFITPLLEPLLYVLAFGLGFSGMIGSVRYAGAQFDYSRFIAPALVAIAVVNNSFFETTYASFVRMYYQKTFDGMLATPLSLEEIMLAEIVWSATKAVGAAVLMMAVLWLFGFIELPAGLLFVPLAFLGGLAFGAIGLFFTGIIASIDMFNLPVFLFYTPLFLFCGTFFPVANLPAWIRPAALGLPLYHLVELARWTCMGYAETPMPISIGYLIGFALIFGTLAITAMRRRLIK